MSAPQATFHYSEVFVPTLWTKKREAIVGRDDEFSKLSKVVRTPGAHAVIFGQRGVGKTTLRDHFSKIVSNEGFGVVTILASPGLKYRGLIERILDKVGFFDARPEKRKPSSNTNTHERDKSTLGMEAFSKGRLDTFDGDAVAEALSSHAPDSGLVVILDEFDVLPRKTDDESVHLHLPHLLRACSHLEDKKAVHFIVVGAAYSGDALLKGHLSLARSLTEIRLSRLKKGDVRNFFEQGFSLSGFAYEKGAVEYLVSRSSGYPFTLHYLGEAVCEFADARPNRTITVDVVRAAMLLAQNNFSRKSKISYRGRSEQEFEVLLRMTYSWKDGLSEKDIYRIDKVGIEIVDVQSIRDVLASLRDEGLLTEVQDSGVYIFSDPYLRVKLMIDREAKLIRNSEDYPFGDQIELPLL